MSRAHVCSAEPEFRNDCGVSCEACRYLIGDRRNRISSRTQWSERERRSLTNLLPLAAVEYAGVPSSSFRSERKVSSALHLVLWLIAFNLLDCIFTARALSMGYIEANPVMAALIEINLPLAMFSKTFIVGLGALILWRFRHMKIAAQGLIVLTAAYGLLTLYHITFQLSA